MRHRVRYAARTLPWVLVIFVACSGGETPWAGTMIDSVGVTLVSNPQDGIWSEDERWTVEEEVRIGAAEGSAEYQFGEIGGIAVDSRGRVFVLDRLAQDVRVFSPDGVYEQTIGRRGGGPGELAQAYFAPGVVPGDTLLVPDVFGNHRINRFAPDGSSLGSFPLPPQLGDVFGLAFTPSGMIALWVRSAASRRDTESASVDRIVTLSTDGRVRDTLLTFPSGETFSPGMGQVTLLAPEPVWEITQDSKLLYGVDDRYRIRVYDASALERVIDKPYEPEPITDRDKEFDWGVPPQARQMVRTSDTYPAFAGIISGPNGTIWVQHVMPISEMSDAHRESLGSLFGKWAPMIPSILRKFHGAPEWDVFDADGRLLGVVTMPPRFVPQVIRGNKVYGITQDELDVDYAVRLRILGNLD